MTQISMELYDALLEGKVSEEKARKAAVSVVHVSEVDNLVTKVDIQLLESKLELAISKLETKIQETANKQINWIIGIAITIIGVMISLKLF